MVLRLLRVLFDSGKEKNGEELLFICEFVCMRGKSEGGKDVSVFGYLSEEARLVYRFKFVEGCCLSHDERWCEKVCRCLVEQYEVLVDPE